MLELQRIHSFLGKFQMKIKFPDACEVEIVESYDEATDTAETSEEQFQAGDIEDVEFLEDHGESVDVQFGDGSVAYNLLKEFFEVIPE